MKHKTAIGVLMVALMLALVVTAQAAVELYDVKASAYVPAFIDYTLNCTADVTIQIKPSDASGNPTGAAIRTVTFTAQSRGFHRYIWLADKDDASTAPLDAYYVAEVSATSNQANWGPITGLYINSDWTHEYAASPLPTVPDTEGFYGIAVNNFPNSPYYGRTYVAHKLQKDIFMYGPDGTYIGKFADDAIGWGTSAPWDISVADDGYVYVCDRSNMFIYCFDANGVYISKSPTTTNHRALFARTAANGVTHIFYTGATSVHDITVEADHVTWQKNQAWQGNVVCNTGSAGNDYGLWASPDLTSVYIACIAGGGAGGNGVTKWNGSFGNPYVIDPAFVKNFTYAADVTRVEAATPYLWVTRMVGYANDNTATTNNEYSRALYKSNAATNAILTPDPNPYNIITWGLMNSADGVGNVASTFGKSTATWAQYYWAMFAEAGTYTTGPKRTRAFYLGTTPSPVIVPGSTVWTPDGTIAADDSDSATVSVKAMDVNGWADITSVTLDLRPLGYGSAIACTLAQDMSDPLGKTVIATRAGIKAKVGTRCTTSYGQPVHKLTATPTDSTGGGYADPDEVKLNVTGDPAFDAYVRHRRVSSWYVDGAQIVAVGGGIPGTTDPRAAGPFTYTSLASDSTGYAGLELSAGTFAVKAQKIGFGSETPVNISIPYAGYTMDLYLRPMTIAEARATTNGTKVNVEGVCFAQPYGLAPTAANGLAARTDTLIKRNQWYVCDANSPANGMLFLVTEPSASWSMQWDDELGADMFGNSTYIGKRPAQGETTMITGMLDAPGGAERRVIVANADVEAAMAAIPSTIDRVYLNRGNIGGLPATPASTTIANVYHDMTAGFSAGWGNFVQVTGATVVAVHADGLPNPNPQDPAYTFPPYFTVVDAAGNWCEVVLESPTSLNAATWTTSVTVGKVFTITGAQGRRTRYGNGCIRIRGLSDLTETGTQGAVLVNLAPAGAVSAGAQWRRVGTTTWKNSGVYEPLAAGSYTVEFKPITGYVTPANAAVTVTNGAVATVTGTYAAYGSLKVTLAPQGAIDAGAQWRRVGTTTWFNSGATESNLAPGSYTVEFKPITGWTSPDSVPVTVTSGATANATGTYSNVLPPSELITIRSANDGDPVNVHGIVSAKIGSAMWIQAADRSIGIRVEGTSTSVAVGNDAQVAGTLDIQDGEAVIVPSFIGQLVASTEAPAAFEMRAREIGGVGAGTTPGVSTGRGPLNVGLKVHFLGMVTSAGTSSYYLWDGTNRSDAPTSDGAGIGVLVEAAPPAGVVAWQDYVEVTGVVGAKDLGGVIAPTIIPITAAQVTSFDTVTADAGTAVVGSWNLLSIPAAPAATSDGDEWSAKAYDPYVVLGPNQSPDDIDGRLYRWENCTGGLNIWDQWSEVGSHGPFGGIVLGDGYWLESPDSWAVSYSAKRSTLDQWIGICAAGWTIIGQPKEHNTFLADVLVHDGNSVSTMYDAVLTNSWIDCTGYWWDNSTQGLVDIGIPDCWSSTDTLMPWHGYWIQAYRGDLALIVPEAPAAP